MPTVSQPSVILSGMMNPKPKFSVGYKQQMPFDAIIHILTQSCPGIDVISCKQDFPAIPGPIRV
ncbi:hypothetical protein AA106556_1599 [Neokomagataea tanensis NBRC 106556]|uniref:Uncharacterized protein n=1 Tax=Neokomagataea tanensis NBRC 106556 TaxID=1223519 RepID=A0ABQ0QKC1_9PROT|nr:hypothetical protein AA106556_1599 [Neokomagataea tanensis NBRC 106556]